MSPLNGMQTRILPLLEKFAAHMEFAEAFRDSMDDADCLAWLERTQFAIFTDPAIPVSARAQISRELSLHGLDRRAGVGLNTNGLPDIVWRAVPAGEFVAGSDKKRDPYAYRTEMPPRHVSMPYTYHMAKYPVTQAQFVAFAQATGDDFVIEADSPPTLPVTNVSWHQANAFCVWLTARARQTGQIAEHKVIRLPDNDEWEKAARGTDGRVYPYGDDAEASHANMSGTGLGEVCVVGLFSEGVSPYGIDDMSGNVFEWCTPSTLRGGSFYMSEEWARCAYRYEREPDQQLKDSGFRIILSDSGRNES